MKPGSPEWLDRVSLKLEKELNGGKWEWWWLSFADPRLPKGTQFLGACIVKACGFGHACMLAHHLGINPGGEVHGAPLPPKAPMPAEKWIQRLLSHAECEAFEREHEN